jgi:GNAT superfamily N-acetyltransferase
MRMSVTLDRVGPAAFDELLPLVRAYHDFESIDLDEDARQAGLAMLLGDDRVGRVWRIREYDATVGYCAICRGYSLEFGGYDGFLDELYLIESARGQGIGRQVLAALPRLAAEFELRALHLEVARDNVRARRLYADAGFEAREKYVLMSLAID